MAKSGILVGIAAAATVVAGMAGCSSNKSNTSSPTGPSSAAPVGNQVIIDGQNQNVTGQVTCTPAGGNVNIGIGDPSSGIGAVVTQPLIRQSCKRSDSGNLTGVTLGYSAGAPNQGTVQATKSGNSYTIKGHCDGGKHGQPAAAADQTIRDGCDVSLMQRSYDTTQRGCHASDFVCRRGEQVCM